jgi:soluble lytic murein transglycosylase-like protein
MPPISDDLARMMQRVEALEARFSPPPVRQAAPTASFAEALDSATTAPPASGPARRTAYDPLIARASSTYNLPSGLLRAVIQAESDFDPRCVSPAGAQGLMQLMPGTANALGVSNAFDPEQNVMGGAQYLRQQLDRFGGDVRLALAAYNAGPGAVRRHGGVPPFAETQRYITRVLSLAGQGE